MTDPTTSAPEGNQDKPVAFCQNCGKRLDQHTVRVVGQAVFCEPCLAARLAGAPAGQPYTPAPGNPYTAPPPILPPGPPNPGFAALLGLIPGVGAMYNEQYGKGIVHLMVFAVLISLSNASSLFGLMAFGWVCYMVIEAHHTARARRDGLPLPNPFGLNEVSERLGFQTNWGARSYTAWQAAPPQPVVDPTQPQTPPYAQPASWGAPVDTPADPIAASWSAPAQAAYATYPPVESPKYNGEWNAEPTPVSPYPGHSGTYAHVPTGIPASGPPDPDFAAQFAAQRNRFPAGAVALIGLGVLFLLTTTGVFSSFPSTSIIGFGLIGLAVWLFLRRITENGLGFTGFDDTSFQVRCLRALRASIWVFLVGLLMILNSFRVLSFQRSWPAFIVVAGIMMLAERLVHAVAPPVVSSVQNAVPPFTPRDGDF